MLCVIFFPLALIHSCAVTQHAEKVGWMQLTQHQLHYHRDEKERKKKSGAGLSGPRDAIIFLLLSKYLHAVTGSKARLQDMKN